MKLSERIEKISINLKKDVYEKDEIFSLSLLALLSGESIFLIGLPGVAKSLVARRLKNVLKDGKEFEYLMNKFSTPEEIFGPIDILELEKGNYVRKIDGYLPDVEVAFLDEIWKAGPAIQNTLLTIINERIYKNGKETINVPLKLLITASNEYPIAGQGLEALYDRFMIRYEVKQIQDEENFYNLLNKPTSQDVKIPVDIQFTTKEISEHISKIDGVQIDKKIFQFIVELKKRIEKLNIDMLSIDEKSKGIYISDRRWKKAAFLIKSSAYYNERKAVDYQDLPVLIHTLWDESKDKEKIEFIFNEAISNSIGTKDFDYEISRVESHLNTIDDKYKRETLVDKEIFHSNVTYLSYKITNGTELLIQKNDIENGQLNIDFYIQAFNSEAAILQNSSARWTIRILENTDRKQILVNGQNSATRITVPKQVIDTSYLPEKENEVKLVQKDLENIEKKINKKIDEINGAANVFLGESFKRTIRFNYRESFSKIEDLLEVVEHKLANLIISKKKK